MSVIAPGAIETGFLRNTNHAETKSHFAERQLKKLSPEEVAEWVVRVAEAPGTSSIDFIELSPIEQVL